MSTMNNSYAMNSTNTAHATAWSEVQDMIRAQDNFNFENGHYIPDSHDKTEEEFMNELDMDELYFYLEAKRALMEWKEVDKHQLEHYAEHYLEQDRKFLLMLNRLRRIKLGLPLCKI